MRYASADKVISHVKDLIEKYGMNTLTICDDQFMINKPRAKEILRRLAPFNLRVEMYQGESVAYIDDEMARLMKAAGIVRAVLPIESGCREVLDKMIEKKVDLDKTKKVIQLLRKHGLWVVGLFVMGFPGETDAHRAETVKWIQEADLDWSIFSPAIPIRGTKLYDMCLEGGYILPSRLGELDYNHYTINAPGYLAKEVEEKIYEINLMLNFVQNRTMRVKDFPTAAKIFKQVIGMFEGHAFAHFYLALCLMQMDLKWQKYERDIFFGGGYGKN